MCASWYAASRAARVVCSGLPRSMAAIRIWWRVMVPIHRTHSRHGVQAGQGQLSHRRLQASGVVQLGDHSFDQLDTFRDQRLRFPYLDLCFPHLVHALLESVHPLRQVPH